MVDYETIYMQTLNSIIYTLLVERISKRERAGWLAKLARKFNHPYGWERMLSKSEYKALRETAKKMGITERMTGVVDNSYYDN